MKRFLVLFSCLAVFAALAEAAPLWMRYPAISPDGKTVAFSYRGDLYTVPASGGRAYRLTTDPSHDMAPVWSPDGKNMAFASDRYGNFDVYLIDVRGGTPTRLTTHSSAEIPYCFSPDGKKVFFGAAMADPASSILFPKDTFKELYSVPVSGGRPGLELPIPAENVSFSHSGRKMLYHDLKGGENTWRKHHQSAVARDIWLYDCETGRHSQLTDFKGEDRTPLFDRRDRNVYYLSERSGSFNVWRFPVDKPSAARQVTRFKTHPVRFLSMAGDGTLCYGYNGVIYTQKPGGEPKLLDVTITEDISPRESVTLPVSLAGGRVSPDGRQVAFLYRGDVFVSSVDYSTTKQITATPAGEASPVFSPDNRTLAYASERDGNWNIYTASIVRKEDPNFPNATLMEEKPLFNDQEHERAQPQFSPDGLELAYVEDRNKLAVMNLKTGHVRRITDGSTIYSTSGRLDYEWSPDGKWFTLSHISNQHDPYSDIGLVSAEGGRIVDLTSSGYADLNPRWVLDGNAILFMSDRYGMRNHASWGSLSDVMIVFLNREAFDRFNMSKEERELLAEAEKAEKAGKAAADERGKEEKGQDEAKGATPEKKAEAPARRIEVELEDIEDRIMRLTPASSQLVDAVLDRKGDMLYYICAFQKGFDLWQMDLHSRAVKIVRSDVDPASLQWDKKMTALFILGKKPARMKPETAALAPISARAEMYLNHAAERAAMFDHVYREEKRRFYDASMHGVDWEAMRDNYARFLPHINNNDDFAEMLSEWLGELNVSHTGCSYRRPGTPGCTSTAELGLLFDPAYAGDGLKVVEIVRQGPFDKAGIDVKPGDLVTALNGQKVTAGMDYFPLLNRQEGRKMLVSLCRPGAAGETPAGQEGKGTPAEKEWDEVVKPVSRGMLNDLLYKRWVKRCEDTVDRLSGGRLGYVHIQSMGDTSFRTIYSAILGKYNDREGIVIDTRFNGGGRLHEDIEVLFSGSKYMTQVIRGKEACDMPSRRWNKPSIMLTCEANYSNAHGTPWVYRQRGLGRLVGMPVPGTMTSVFWENLQDSSLRYGIPVIGYRLEDGSYLENTQLEPDIKVANTPENVAAGEDRQLETGVRELLRELDEARTSTDAAESGCRREPASEPAR